MLTIEQYWDLVPHTFRRYGITFSKREAAKLVGGTARLMKLIRTGKIRKSSDETKPNSRWRCDGGDVLRHIEI